MSDPARDTSAGDRDEQNSQDDAGDPNRDREFLIDTPPTQINDDAVQANTTLNGEEPGDNMAAARD